MNGNSFICLYKLGSKTQERLTTLPNEYFGEGSMLYDNKLIQLTWKNGLGLIYDAATLKQTGQFRIGGEGWGLTYDGKNLIMSDGSHRLFYLDKETYAVSKIVEVYDNKGKVLNINELEYIDGIIYANIWQTDKIAKINTTNGKVMAYINCEGLLTEAEIQEYKCDVLNGIAYDPQTKKLYITGKNWPKIFELKLDTIPSHASKETIEVINVKNTIELL
jgi:glutamine cyclotransferase